MRVLAAALALVLAGIVLTPVSGANGDTLSPIQRSASGSAAPAPPITAPFDDPGWAPGMQWKYRADIRMDQGGGDSIDLRGNMTTDTVSWSNVTILNRTYPSLKMMNAGSGTAKGQMGPFPLDGTWTMAGVVHAAKNSTDELQVEQSFVMQNSQPPITITMYEIANYTPALR